MQVVVQQSTQVQVMTKAQQKAMEMERCEAKVVAKKRRIILDKTTFLEKGIKFFDPKQFMWIQTKQNYDKHVERMENWKDIIKEEDQAFKERLATLFFMEWHAPMPNVMLEFLNIFLIKSAKDNVYVLVKN